MSDKPDATTLGRDTAAHLTQSLMLAAEISGDPKKFWLGFLGLINGTMCAQVGLHEGVELMCGIAATARNARDTGKLPNTAIDAAGKRHRLDN